MDLVYNFVENDRAFGDGDDDNSDNGNDCLGFTSLSSLPAAVGLSHGRGTFALVNAMDLDYSLSRDQVAQAVLREEKS